MKRYDNDPAMIAGMKNRDEKALRACIVKYQSYVSYIVGNIIGKACSQADQEELIADVFLALWNHVHTIEEQKASNLKAYIGAIARNKARNRIRTVSRAQPEIELDDTIMVEVADASSAVLKKEMSRILMDCISLLPPKDQRCFIEYYYYGKTIRVIASELDMSESAVKSKLARGRNKLKSMIMEEAAEYANFNL